MPALSLPAAHALWIAGLLGLLAGCQDSEPSEPSADPAQPRVWSCTATEEQPAALRELGCAADFDRLAAAPLDSPLTGAESVKTVVDRSDGDALYFQNSARYPIHWAFTSEHLSGGDLPLVPDLATFNATEYSSPSRRFLLGAVTHYAGPDLWVYEIAPYDGATAEMIRAGFEAVAAASYFGAELRFFASSAALEATVAPLWDELRVVTAAEVYAGVDYQALNPAEAYGRLSFVRAESLEDEVPPFRDIVVLDRVPNDISVVMGIITEDFQTPLSHVNVLSRNRGTPNMALRGAFDHPTLRALEGQWVHLVVGPDAYRIEASSVAEADAWWEARRPEAVQIPGLDASVRGLVDLETQDLHDAIKTATRALGGKAAHYAALRRIEGLPVPPAFAVPVAYYQDFLADGGFRERIEALLADPEFQAEPERRAAELEALRADLRDAPVDPELLSLLEAKLRAEFPSTRMRFRSSTNAEDLDGFTGAGLYTSKSAELDDPDAPLDDAIRKVWASVWSLRAFEERSYRGIDHLSVAMALLVHRSFPTEDANGVALTQNPFDPSGASPAFYINVQQGDVSVVQPPEGVSTESLLLYYDHEGQPVRSISSSSLVPEGETVLSRAQLLELAAALDRIRSYFAPAYGQGKAWWAMDVEFKFDRAAEDTPSLFIKQARPYQ